MCAHNPNTGKKNFEIKMVNARAQLLRARVHKSPFLFQKYLYRSSLIHQESRQSMRRSSARRACISITQRALHSSCSVHFNRNFWSRPCKGCRIKINMSASHDARRAYMDYEQLIELIKQTSWKMKVSIIHLYFVYFMSSCQYVKQSATRVRAEVSWSPTMQLALQSSHCQQI